MPAWLTEEVVAYNEEFYRPLPGLISKSLLDNSAALVWKT